MRRESHVRFCERAGVRFPRATRLVILCKPGNGPQAMEAMRTLMTKLGLTVNEKKTRLVNLPEQQFDFLGYSVGRFYGKDGKAYFGTRPSKKSVKSLLGRIHEQTSSRWNALSPESRIEHLNPLIRGWAG